MSFSALTLSFDVYLVVLACATGYAIYRGFKWVRDIQATQKHILARLKQQESASALKEYETAEALKRVQSQMELLAYLEQKRIERDREQDETAFKSMRARSTSSR